MIAATRSRSSARNFRHLHGVSSNCATAPMPSHWSDTAGFQLPTLAVGPATLERQELPVSFPDIEAATVPAVDKGRDGRELLGGSRECGEKAETVEFGSMR